MKYKQIIFMIIVSSLTLILFGSISSVNARENPPLSQSHIERIKYNCVQAQSTLSRLHDSDTLLRVDRGRVYEYILSKLMAPFNGRVTSNRLDSVTMVTTTKEYERELNKFRESYISYERSINSSMNINCIENPSEFYYAVDDARTKRQIVHSHTLNLESMIKSYSSLFESLYSSVKAQE